MSIFHVSLYPDWCYTSNFTESKLLFITATIKAVKFSYVLRNFSYGSSNFIHSI